jgi:hypothetical protein
MRLDEVPWFPLFIALPARIMPRPDCIVGANRPPERATG